jgi:release factor glutamine methyltransferase
VTSISHTIDALRSQGLDRLDAQILVLHCAGRPAHDRAWLLGHGTDELPTKAMAQLQPLAQRRLNGEPVAYLTGHKEFYGLDLMVDARVLVPRPDTETLVDWAIDILESHPQAKVVDLGTGSGAIALALKSTQPGLEVMAVDASTDALTVASANAQRLGLTVDFVQTSWLNGVTGPFDAIVSNPPYIADQDHHLAALTHEPYSALASGSDGLDDIRSIVSQATTRLKQGGWLLFEHGYDQSPEVCALLRAAGFADVQCRLDLAGIARCSGGQWPA